MKWPAWFPYPQSWFRAVLQFLYLVPVGLIYKTFTEKTSIFEFAAREPFMLGLLTLGALLIPFLTVVWGQSILFVDRKPSYWPKKLPGPYCFWEGLYSILILLLSIFFLWVFVLLSFRALTNDGTRNLSTSEAEQTAVYASAAYFLFSAWMYQAEHLIRKGIEDTKVTEPAATHSTKPVDKTGIELERLRNQTGYTTKQPPKN
jgi:hypothetical protein